MEGQIGEFILAIVAYGQVDHGADLQVVVALAPAEQAAEYIGPAMVGGVQTDQFAFRQEEIDWQIWIQQGDRPLPLKIVIIDKTDPTRPEFSARLSWNTSPRFDASTFAFSPASADTSIAFHKPAGASQ